MVDQLAEVAIETVRATAEILVEVEPRRRRWKVARIAALVVIFGAIIGIPIAILLSLG